MVVIDLCRHQPFGYGSPFGNRQQYTKHHGRKERFRLLWQPLGETLDDGLEQDGGLILVSEGLHGRLRLIRGRRTTNPYTMSRPYVKINFLLFA